MKKRAIKLLALTLVAIMTFFAVGCDMDAIFAPLSEIQPDVPSGEWNSSTGNSLVTGEGKQTNSYAPSFIGTIQYDRLDFEGEEVVILLPDTKEAVQSWKSESPDTILEEFVEIRNSAATEAINMKLSFEFAAGADFASRKANLLVMASQDVASDLHYYDVVSAPVSMLGDTALRGFLSGVNNHDYFPYFDFEIPCWNQTLVSDCEISDRLYFMSGATEVSNMLDASVIWHNKTLYDEKKEATDHESIAELARDGLWTYDELYRWALRLYEDSNGVPGQQIDDTYGVGIEGEGKYPYADAFRSAWDVRFAEEKPTGEIALNGLSSNGDRALNALEMVKALYGASGTYVNAKAEEFMAGRYMFYLGTFDSLTGAPDGEDTFELLPMPKYDIDQSEYKTFVEDPMVTAILNHENSTKIIKGDAVSAILQLVAEESHMGVYGNLWDYTPLKMNSSNNDMIELICLNTQLTFEKIYAPQLAGLDRLWSDVLISDADLSSAYAEKKGAYRDAIDDINTWFGLIV
jgi:hypothetical protein